jgi:hypothetical protein
MNSEEIPFDPTDSTTELSVSQYESQVNHSSDPFDELQLANPVLQQQSDPFVGRWNTLISTTNWEKGKIIFQWRTTLQDGGAQVTAYSDEAWSQRVGGVTAQHVGRLRRVYERFNDTYESYQGLYWSHFLAAMDWNDAEIWLEGASSSRWSVSQMRAQRWEAVSGDPKLKPQDSDVISGELDEDFTPISQRGQTAEDTDDEGIVASGPRNEGPDFGESSDWDNSNSPEVDNLADDVDDYSPPIKIDYENPFASLGTLPVDIAEALEQFKLAIIRHRTMKWGEVRQEDVIQAILALKTFAER